MPPSTSALCVTMVPAKVTGAEPPDMAMESGMAIWCILAASMMQPVNSPISLSGLTGQLRKRSIGRSASLS